MHGGPEREQRLAAKLPSLLNQSLKRNWICNGRQSNIIHACTVDLYVPHVEEPPQKPLFEPDLFDGTKLQIGNVTTKQAAFQKSAWSVTAISVVHTGTIMNKNKIRPATPAATARKS